MERERNGGKKGGGGDVSIFWVVFEGKKNESGRGGRGARVHETVRVGLFAQCLLAWARWGEMISVEDGDSSMCLSERSVVQVECDGILAER